jgi:hypothetical protein
MGTPIAPPIKKPDFNNDGIEDYVRRISHCEKVNGTWPCGIFFDDAPHIRSLWTTDSYEDDHATPGEYCSITAKSAVIKPWIFSGTRHSKWLEDSRFFTSDRSMWFMGGMRVLVRGNSKSDFIRRIIILFDTQEKLQAGLPYAQFGDKCFIVSIEDLVWLTKSNKPLDMQRAIQLARQLGPLSKDVAKTLEGQVAQLIIRVSAMVDNLKDASPEVKRDAVVKFLKKSSIYADLPNGWEASLLHILKLPPIVPEWVVERRRKREEDDYTLPTPVTSSTHK